MIDPNRYATIMRANLALADMHDAKPGDKTVWLGAYFKGYRKPNYPVPAIRYEVDYIQDNGETFVTVLWYMSNPQLPVCLEYWH